MPKQESWRHGSVLRQIEKRTLTPDPEPVPKPPAKKKRIYYVIERFWRDDKRVSVEKKWSKYWDRIINHWVTHRKYAREQDAIKAFNILIRNSEDPDSYYHREDISYRLVKKEK